MRPQHDGHGGRPSPQSHTPDSPFVPRARSGETTDFTGRIRQERPAGKSGRHRLDSAATQRATQSLPVTPEPLPLPSAGSPPAAVEVPPAGEIAPAWHDLTEPADNPPAAFGRSPALTTDELPPPPPVLSLDPPAIELWDSTGWDTPPAIEVWDSTEEHSSSQGPDRDGIRVPRQAAPSAGEEPLEIAAAPAIYDPARLDKTALADRVVSLEDRYLTPAGPLTPGLAPVRHLRGPVKAARYVGLAVIALLGITAVVLQPQGPKPTDGRSTSSQSLLDDRAAAAADRSLQRGATASATSKPSPSATPIASASPKKPAPKPTPTKKPKPAVAPLPLVAGFDKDQMTNARTIVRTGQKLGVPSQGLLISLMTVMQESNLYNLASPVLPESYNYPHQGEGSDYDSCGLFQQRTSMGWGTVQQIMDPVYSATKFFEGLLQVAGWQNMELTLAAQAVQGSAFPYAYAQHESAARTVLGALT